MTQNVEVPLWAIRIARSAILKSRETLGSGVSVEEAVQTLVIDVAGAIADARRRAIEEAAACCECIAAAIDDLPEPDDVLTLPLAREMEREAADQCAADIRALAVVEPS